MNTNQELQVKETLMRNGRNGWISPALVGSLLLLLLIGPLGGLVSIRLAVRVDPLTAIGQ